LVRGRAPRAGENERHQEALAQPIGLSADDSWARLSPAPLALASSATGFAVGLFRDVEKGPGAFMNQLSLVIVTTFISDCICYIMRLCDICGLRRAESNRELQKKESKQLKRRGREQLHCSARAFSAG
jgi:hypothetical protein